MAAADRYDVELLKGWLRLAQGKGTLANRYTLQIRIDTTKLNTWLVILVPLDERPAS